MTRRRGVIVALVVALTSPFWAPPVWAYLVKVYSHPAVLVAR